MIKKINALNLKNLNIDIVEYKTINHFQRKESYIEYLYNMCFLNEELFNEYLMEYGNSKYTEGLNQEDIEMLFVIQSVKDIYLNYKNIISSRIEDES